MPQLSLRFVGHIQILKKILRIITKKFACKFGEAKTTFKEQSAWSTWIYRLSLNVCLTFLKKKKNNKQNAPSDLLPDEVLVDSRAFADESLNQLYDAIRQVI